ncbi:MAG: hypothetical protein HQL56_10310 [Magnetococcales bacterium]|nr:hypothetical protein [Magnetococcales bacterium]
MDKLIVFDGDFPIAATEETKTMYAVEIQTAIIDHRLDVHSDRLPANAANVRVIVLVEEGVGHAESSILDLAHAARASFPQTDPLELRREFAAMRDEWGIREPRD